MGVVRALVDEYAELTLMPREQLRALPWREFQQMAQYIPVLRRGRVSVLRSAHGEHHRREFNKVLDQDVEQLFDGMRERSRAIIVKLDDWLKENTKRGA